MPVHAAGQATGLSSDGRGWRDRSHRGWWLLLWSLCPLDWKANVPLSTQAGTGQQGVKATPQQPSSNP